jgi:hypothetical protein
MLRSLKELQGYTIRAVDGDIGRVHGFYFDDLKWIIRYLVVDTGTWLPGRLVLLSPTALGRADGKSFVLPISLSKSQVENSPPIEADQPVSRQKESELHRYYGWHPYWSGTAVGLAVHAKQLEEENIEEGWGDPHLRSSREVIGYHIQARDGEIGHVEDFIADDDAWMVRYMVIDTHNWLPGKKVLIVPAWAKEIDWVEKKVHIDLKRDTIKAGPEFDPSEPVNREYEIRFYDYYGRPIYW